MNKVGFIDNPKLSAIINITIGLKKSWPRLIRLWLLIAIFISLNSAAAALADSSDKVAESVKLGRYAQSERKRTLDFNWSAWLETTIRQSTYSHKPISMRQRIWAETSIKSKGPLSAFVSGYVEGDFSVFTRYSYEKFGTAAFNEAYLTIDTSRLDFILGLQQIRWGEADSMSAADVINPIDYRDPLATARSNQRLSVVAADVRADLGFGLLDLVIVPWPRFSSLPKSGSPWEPKALRYLRQADKAGIIVTREGQKARHTQLGARFKLFRQGFDLAFIYFRGYEHAPRFSLGFDQSVMAPAATASYDTYETYALSAAVSLFNSTLRAEAAYKSNYPFQSSLISVEKRDDFQVVAGWDKNFFTNLIIQAQGFYFRYSGAEVWGVDRERYGISFNLENKFFNEALRSGVRGVYYLTSHDYCLELFNEYDFDDHLKFKIGYMLLGGKDDGDIGQYDKNDHVYAGIKYYF
ncbi:MAG: hypothetical protein LBV23_10675 [Deltaproteobacteria bacterium]|nr:hypothetical protein [Deltaproteobacteria bacterium]